MLSADEAPMSAPTQLPDPRRDRRQRRLLVGLAILFFAPIGLSFYLYYGHSALQPLGRVNRGVLVEPPRELPAGALPSASSGKWTLLFVGPGDCPDLCREKLYDTRQVRLALDRDMTRVQRVFVATGVCCDQTFLEREHPDLITVRADANSPLLAALTRESAGAAAAAGRIYVVDPLGNVMMWYAADAQPKGLLEDMKRLLKLSHIG
jgi:hypothetical protein